MVKKSYHPIIDFKFLVILFLLNLLYNTNSIAQPSLGGLTGGNSPVSTTGSSGSANGSSSSNLSNLNPGTAADIRMNYFKRFPFAKAVYNADQLSSSLPKSSEGPGMVPPTSFMSYRAYEPCIQPIGYYSTCYGAPVIIPMNLPGHFLIGALPQHMPQYYNPLEAPAYIQTWPMPVEANLPTKRDEEIFQNQLTTFGLPMSDTQFQIIDRENKQRFLELMFDPERWMWMYTAVHQVMGTAVSNSFAGIAGAQFQATAQSIISGSSAGSTGSSGSTPSTASPSPLGAMPQLGSSTPSIPGVSSPNQNQATLIGSPNPQALVNVANENAAQTTLSSNNQKTITNVVYMIQKLYKNVFVPMAILFLLPGAILTQMKYVISKGLNFQASDATGPFEGIIRAMIAVFLIPATQLIVSYSIDIGNSMSYTVAQWVDFNNVILPWVNQATYNVPNSYNAMAQTASNGSSSPVGGLTGGLTGGSNGGSSSNGVGGFFNSITNMLGSSLGSLISSYLPSWANTYFGWANSSGSVAAAGGTGVSTGMPKALAYNETTSYLSSIMQFIFNVLEWFFSQMILILGAFQLVFMCYLFLMGPIAAAFFAWPDVQGSGQILFKNVFSSWLTAVINVSLWRFYWMIVFAIMSVYAADQVGVQNIDLQWDIVVFVCFLGLLMVVPFSPFSFDPGQAVTSTLYYGSQLGTTFSKALSSAGANTPYEAQINKLTNEIGQVTTETSNVSSQIFEDSMFSGNSSSGSAPNINQANALNPKSQNSPNNSPPPPSKG